MPADTAQRIIAKIEQYAREPETQANNVTALKGREGIRLRVGDWRVIMNDDGVVLAVLEIGPRGSVYE
jgi:mRNA interferase RelE/StbE